MTKYRVAAIVFAVFGAGELVLAGWTWQSRGSAVALLPLVGFFLFIALAAKVWNQQPPSGPVE